MPTEYAGRYVSRSITSAVTVLAAKAGPMRFCPSPGEAGRAVVGVFDAIIVASFDFVIAFFLLPAGRSMDGLIEEDPETLNSLRTSPKLRFNFPTAASLPSQKCAVGSCRGVGRAFEHGRYNVGLVVDKPHAETDHDNIYPAGPENVFIVPTTHS